MRTKVFNLIEKYDMLRDEDTVVVGVSGGADSVCLLFLLCEYIKEKSLNIDLEIVHVNHGIRDTALRDEEFTKQYCMKLEERFGISLPCHVAHADIPKLAKDMKISEEEAGRYIRYDAMNKILGEKKGVIAVAHHANDRAETMLFNLFRGSGLKGASGISPVNGKIIRPLLGVTRREIEELLDKEGLEFVTDETNLSDDYTRNKIRHNIINYAVKNITENAVENMNSAAEQLYLAEDFISEYTLKAALRCTITKEKDRIVLNTENLVKEHPYICDRILYEALCYVAGKKKDISKEHISQLRALLSSTGSKRVSLIYKVEGIKEYNLLTISRCKGEEKSNINGFLDMKVLENFSMEDIPKDTYTKWFDYDRISSVAILRNRAEGDFLSINKNMQHQSLQDYFVNEKIPKDQRDNIPLLADKNHIMWVIGMRISEYYKVTELTRRVLEVHYEREELQD